MFISPFPPVGQRRAGSPLRSADVVNEPINRPAARLGYAVDDLDAFVQAGERRLAELAAAIAVAEARRDAARTRSADAPALRRRIAEEWLQAYAGADGGAGVGA